MYKKAFELSYKNKKVEIEIQDFIGDVRNIEGTEDIFKLKLVSDSKDKGQSILATEADINFYADDYFNIDELKTVGETDIKVKYYEDDNLHWSGFVIPDFFSTSVDITPVVSMVATDRVGTLKEISNNSESNIPIQILVSCLKQTGQDLPINLIIGNNHFETPIQLERIDEIASYDVIRSFMVLFNCKVVLFRNAWWVVNKKLLETGFINYKSYNSDGVGGSITPYEQELITLDLANRGGQREIKPTASEVSLFLEFGGSKKYPKNWDFEEWIINPQATSTALFNYWELKGVFYPYPFTDLLPIANNNQITGYEVSGNSLIATKDTSINYDSYNLQLRTSTQQGSGTDQSKMSYRHLESSYSKVVFLDGRTEIKVSINFTNPSGEFINVTPVIRTKNSNGTLKRYFAIDNDKSVKKAGEASINLFGVEPIRVEATQSETKIAVQTKWENIFITDDSTLELAEGDTADVMLIIWGVRFYPLGAPNIKSYIDTFIHSANISFNDYEVTGKGLIFKIKQGGEKFSKSREPETILFSDKINQGVNGYFYNYKYDDTSIVDLPSEFALSSVRERADMFSKARDYYSLDGNFIVNPLAKYTCGLKSFVLVGGENRREDAGIIVEEIVSNTLNRTDFIYTYFDDGKDKVKSIGTASGGSSSGGGGGVSTPQLWKVDEDGNIYTEYNAYSLKNLSAFGLEEEQGGGLIINVIDNLASTSKTDPLSANQGRYLKTLIDNIEAGEGGQVRVDWEAITGKPTTFAPSAHTHIIGDVTGLQGALDDKASLSQLDDKEDKFTKNSAFNKNFGTGLNDVARGNHTHTFASLTSIPTTLAGYGITDGANKVHTHTIEDVTDLQTTLDDKADITYIDGKVKTNVPLNAKFTDTIVDISGKVDKVTGKGLSTNDFTTAEKNKLAILENQTRESLGVENVTNESKEAMFFDSTFTGLTSANTLDVEFSVAAKYISASVFANLIDANVENDLSVGGTTKTTILELNTNWKFVKVGDNIELQFDGVTKQIMTNNGDIVATAGVTAFY